jgi:hypothetical protein
MLSFAIMSAECLCAVFLSFVIMLFLGFDEFCFAEFRYA